MKECLKKNKIFLSILILIILSGIVLLFTLGFNKNSEYQAGTRIEVYIPKGYEKQDIINIAKDSFVGKDFSFEEVEKLNQVAAIKIKDYTEDELKNFKNSICEKYNIKEEALELHEISLPITRIRTTIEPYVFPVSLITVLSSIYILLRNLKSENKWKIVLKVIVTLAIVLGIYFSLILIFRLPFGIYTMPIALGIYIITLLILSNKIRE